MSLYTVHRAKVITSDQIMGEGAPEGAPGGGGGMQVFTYFSWKVQSLWCCMGHEPLQERVNSWSTVCGGTDVIH